MNQLAAGRASVRLTRIVADGAPCSSDQAPSRDEGGAPLGRGRGEGRFRAVARYRSAGLVIQVRLGYRRFSRRRPCGDWS